MHLRLPPGRPPRRHLRRGRLDGRPALALGRPPGRPAHPVRADLASFADFRSGARHVLVDDGRWGRRVLVKRLHLGLDGALTVASDNPRSGSPKSGSSRPPTPRRPDGAPALVSERTGARVDVTVVGRVVWPRETDDERTVRAMTEALERLAANGFFST